MHGWIVPPPGKPKKSRERLRKERIAKVRWLDENGFLKSECIREALLKVPREIFIPDEYRDHAYEEVPLPLPGKASTISCPHSYPLFYEPLGLDRGHRFLEIGLGSGYGAAVAREVVGSEGLVVSIEIDPLTLEFGKRNLEKAGYHDVVTVLGDGGLGYPPLAPYDRIALTAACAEVPPPLLEQLAPSGRLITPLRQGWAQLLTLVEKQPEGLRQETLCEVLYVNLRGRYESPDRR